MLSVINKPLKLVHEEIKASAFITMKAFLLLLSVIIVIGSVNAGEPSSMQFSGLSLVLIVLLQVQFGLLLVKLKFRNETGKNNISNRLAFLYQYHWFKKVSVIANTVSGLVFSTCIYVWFVTVLVAIAVFIHLTMTS